MAALNSPFHILYLVHDVSDAAVHKRVSMLRDGGASVTIAGFRRRETAPDHIAGCPVLDMGQTHNGGFAQRMLAVCRQVLTAQRMAADYRGADCIIARNLEMLAIAVRGRSLCAIAPPLVYESLDIHRLLLRPDKIGSLLRQLEAWLCKRASLLITSSPAFVREYFEGIARLQLPLMLLENKVYDADGAISAQAGVTTPRQVTPPWKIGWFGAIRCRKSLEILSELVRNQAGRVEVIIRGRPALDQFDDFHAQVAAVPGIRFEGPYRNPEELAAIYNEVHFSWCIDMFEEGLNSSWLLPNRLYEGGLFATVPLAQSEVEIGQVLRNLAIGVVLNAPLERSLHLFFESITADDYTQLASKSAAVPIQQWLDGQKAATQLVDELRRLKAA